MPRKRKSENKGFPTGWRRIGKAIYYNVPSKHRHDWDGKSLFKLGDNTADAYREWAKRVTAIESARTIAELLDQYMQRVVPEKAPRTQFNNKKEVIRVRKAFGHIGLNELLPKHVYRYFDERKSKRAAKLEIALLSHAFTKAVQWGFINSHPFKSEVRLEGFKPRRRYVEDWEIRAAMALKPARRGDPTKMLQAYIDIKNMTGMSQTDLLLLQPKRDFRAEGIYIIRHKVRDRTGRATIYLWTPDLQAACEAALSARPVEISPFLFCKRNGHGYFDEQNGTASGFDSIWHRFMARLLNGGHIKERFMERDIRAKAGTDAPTKHHAQDLLAHSDIKITEQVYIRKPVKVTPLNSITAKE